MNSLYLENLIIGSLFRFFSQYFSVTTWPTQSLLPQLVIAQLALQTFHPLFSGSPRVPDVDKRKDKTRVSR